MKSYLIVFLISMVPLIELRGAIPYAVAFGIPLTQAYIIAIIGNMIPVPFIYFFARKVLEWGKDKPVIGRFFTFCLEKGEKGGKALQAKAGRGLFLALLLFVGIPLPGTGACTELWLPAFWIWISSPAFLQLCWGFCWLESLWELQVQGCLERCSRCSANCGSRISTQKKKAYEFYPWG